jgi:hypothetical protein
MLRQLCFAGALAALLPLLPAQSLTTTFAGGNGLGANSTIYFDLVLAVPLSFHQFDVNSSSTVTTAGSIEVRWCAGTYIGNDTNAGAWTLGGTGTLSAAGQNTPTPVLLAAPFVLPPGNYGFAVTFLGVAQSYTNGNGTSTPGSGTNQTYSTAELTLLAGASAGGPPGTAIANTPRVFNGTIHYTIAGSGTVAQRSTYGTGCYQRFASFYEYFATSATFDLANTSMSMLWNGSGYLVLPGVTAFVPPSAAATTVTLGDDAQTAVNLSTPFPHAGGATSSLVVCSNGYVSVATGNGTGYTASAQTMLNAPQTGWWNWSDYNPSATAGGRVKFEQIGSVAYVTWDGVYDYGGTGPANANTFQFQFDSASGSVHLVMQGMSTIGGSISDARLVGFSPGGNSLDPGSTDLSVVVPQTISLPPVEAPLALAASARPVLGTSVNLVTSNAPGQNVGVNFLGFGQVPAPGVDLGFLGAAGCVALIDVNQAIGNVISNAGLPGVSMSITLPIPNDPALNGWQLFSQSLWLDATANAFGAVTSNGVALVLGNL